jgi:hypothetical protein
MHLYFLKFLECMEWILVMYCTFSYFILQEVVDDLVLKMRAVQHV